MKTLPNNWVETTLSDVAEIYDSERKPVNSSEREKRISGKEKSELYPYYGATGQVGYIDNYIFNDEFVLLGEDGAPFLEFLAKKAFIVRGKFWVNNHAHILKSKTSNKFLCFFLNQFDYHNFVTGTTRYKLTQSDMCKIPIPLPPLAEQGRIVAKIEELFAGIDAGVENLKSVKNQIALYRQSVLKSAFDFDASTFSALKNLIDKVRYGTSKKCSTEKNVNSMPVYRIPNIDFKKGILDKTDLKFASFDYSEKSSLMLKSGDILIIRSNGSLNLVGRAALVYNTDTNGLYAGYLMRLRIKDTEKLLPKFLLHFLNSGKARAYIEEKAKSTSGVNNINSEEISDLQIPVPTLAEQERIVAEIESRFERADALETAVDRALNDAEKLKQAVLKKAFSGKLVPQNPDDEPASVLLDRIRAARASELPAKKGKRKKTEVDSQL